MRGECPSEGLSYSYPGCLHSWLQTTWLQENQYLSNRVEKSDLSPGFTKTRREKAQHASVCEHLYRLVFVKDGPTSWI